VSVNEVVWHSTITSTGFYHIFGILSYHRMIQVLHMFNHYTEMKPAFAVVYNLRVLLLISVT